MLPFDYVRHNIYIFLFVRRRMVLAGNFFLVFGNGGEVVPAQAPRAHGFFFRIQFNENVFCVFRIRADAAFYTGMFVLFFNVYFFTIIFLLHLDRRGKVCYNLCNIAMVPCSALLRRYGRCVFEGFI